MSQRPEGITDEHLEYLDELRESGDTNMWGSGPYIQKEFELDREEAEKIHMYWMDTFGNPDR